MILCLVMGVLTYCGNSNTAILLPGQRFSPADTEAIAQTYMRAEAYERYRAASPTPRCDVGMQVWDAKCIMEHGYGPQCMSRCAR